jgi:Na+(H+)/acetate symporter ActP
MRIILAAAIALALAASPAAAHDIYEQLLGS